MGPARMLAMAPTSQNPTVALDTGVPARLFAELEALVQAGWARTVDEVVIEALRRFVESHREALQEAMIREDVDWGLRGSD